MNNPGITSFRALAFLAVFLFHAGGRLYLEIGYLGVQAFFVLSGFLLTPILLDMKSDLTKKDFFIRFYGRRALRIFPLYYAYLAFVALLSLRFASPFGDGGSTRNFLSQLPWTLTYTYDFYHASSFFKHTALATHFWSLAVEEQFYLVWPVAMYLTPLKNLRRFLLAVAAAGPLARLLLAMVSHTGLLPLNPRMDLFIYVLPFSHVDAFATGGYFALYGKGRRGLSFWVVLLLVILLGVTTGWLSTSRISWRGFGYGPFMQDSYKYLWGYSLVNCLFASMLVQIRRRALMPRFFENSFLVYLGTISYGLYVFHFPVLWVVWRTGRAFSDTTQTLTALLLTGVISMLSYELMEKRLINLKDRYFARTSSPDPKGLWARP